MVLVPTAHSGRQLRQSLPEHAGRAILAPSVVTPDVLFRPLAQANAATKIEWWHAWAEVLMRHPLEHLDALFPQLDNVDRDFNWALKAVTRFTKLKTEITNVNHSLTQVAEASEEPDRWKQLAELDQQVIELLSNRNLSCPADAKRQAALHWQPPQGVSSIIILGVPDLPVLAQLALSQSSIPVEILIQADESLAETFSLWGVPTPEYWAQCPIHIPQPAAEHISVSATSLEAVDSLLSELTSHSSDSITLAVTDSALSPLLSDKIASAGWPSFDPDGTPLSHTGLWAFLNLYRRALANSNNFLPIPSLLKAPESSSILTSLKNHATISQSVDSLNKHFLPQNLSHAIRCANGELKEVLTELQAQLVNAQNAPASIALEALFDKIENAHSFPDEWVPTFLEAITAIKNLELHKQSLSTHHALDLVLNASEGVKIQNDRSGSAIDQLGWLEIPFSQEPNLRILGLHEGHVPERPHDDGFLPESLRQHIGLYSRKQLESRDAYLLSNMLSSRADSGSTKVFLCQTSPSGEERQASRLLMRCPSHELPARVQHCFNESLESKSLLPAYHPGSWKLSLPHPPAWPENKTLTISPSRLRDFLHCPFRFYLKQIEGFQRETFDAQELDAAQFGNLIHDVLERFGLDPSMRDLSEEIDVIHAFDTLLEDTFNKTYGSQTSLPLSIQKESAQQRLHAFAAQQAAMRREGWKIHHVELAVGTSDNEIPWQVANTPVRMRVDRIDVHEESGKWRVIDYKTSKKLKKPSEEHFENARTFDHPNHNYGELLPPASKRARSERRWRNLQLPLYAEFVKQHFALTELPELAYVAFPAAAASTGLQVWNQYDDTLHASAMEWTHNAILAIQNNQFPIRQLTSAQTSWDDFAALSPEGLEHAFDL
ncbi:PD-(D/E)XK nuclease family protein [Rubritalea tangerina]